MATKTNSISRPAARKGTTHTSARRRATGSTKPPKSASPKRRAHTPEPPAAEVEPTTQARPVRRFAEPPKVQGELPTPVATFVF